MKPIALSGLRKSCASLSKPSVTNVQYSVTLGKATAVISNPLPGESVAARSWREVGTVLTIDLATSYGGPIPITAK